MIVDMYFSCWNNADLLGFFFRHYDPIVRRYVVFDDGSTDGSLDLLRAHPRVEVRAFNPLEDGASRTHTNMASVENCWRQSSADADWVMLCDSDEHLYHHDLPGYLLQCLAQGVTIIPALGYQMVSPNFPSEGRLCDTVTMGAAWVQMSKLNVFSPRAITALNYGPGRHTAHPTGDIVVPARDELLLLHYKYLDFERVYQRHEIASERLNAIDRQHGFGHRWRFSRDELRADWAQFEQRQVDVRLQEEPWRTHEGPRWWQDYPRASGASVIG